MSSEPQGSSRRPEYLGEPTLAQVMRRPQWILALLLALLVAGVFAWLGRWQMDHAIRDDADTAVDTETVRPLADLLAPETPTTEAAAGAVARLDGAFVPEDLDVVSPRDNGGETGAWVVGHLVTEGPDAADGGQLAVAVGWAPSVEDAEAAAARLAALPELAETRGFEGRLMPAEGAVVPDADEDPQTLHAMVPSQLVNQWREVDGAAYSAYLVLHAGSGTEIRETLEDAGLAPIDSVPPEAPQAVNWLNVFYAIEWVVFAGFAVFLWYRLARDSWEKEHEIKLLLAAEGGPADGGEAGREQDPDPEPRAGQGPVSGLP